MEKVISVLKNTNKCPQCMTTLRGDEKTCPGCGAEIHYVNQNKHSFNKDSLRAIVKYSETGDKLEEYANVYECRYALKDKHRGDILNACRGKRKTACG